MNFKEAFPQFPIENNNENQSLEVDNMGIETHHNSSLRKSQPPLEPPKETETPHHKVRLENRELSESPERVMEQAREERVGILSSTLDRISDELHISPPARRLMSWLLNLTPISMPKMLIETVRGETVGGEKMKPYDRLMHIAINGANVIAWGMGIWNISTGQSIHTP